MPRRLPATALFPRGSIWPSPTSSRSPAR